MIGTKCTCGGEYVEHSNISVKCDMCLQVYYKNSGKWQFVFKDRGRFEASKK